MGKLVALIVEQLKFKRAMRELARLEWSTDFLIYLLRKSQIQGITVRVRETGGRTLEITANDAPSTGKNYLEQEHQLTMDEWDALLGVGGVKNA